MTWGAREELLNLPNESINRDDLNPATVLRRIKPGSGIILAGTGLGDETISVNNAAVVFASRTVAAGTGLAGGGDLSADRTLSVASPAVLASRVLTAGSFLTGGGDLSADRRLDFNQDANFVWSGVHAFSQAVMIDPKFQGARVLSQMQYIPDSQLTTIVFDTEDFDTKGWVNLGTHNDRITVDKSGYYLVMANLAWVPGWTSDYVSARLLRNGATVCYSELPKTNTAQAIGHTLSTILAATAGNFFQLRALQVSGATQSTMWESVHLAVTYLGSD